MAEQFLIGDVAALTGIASGRIRHYEKIGLLRAEHLSNGYRVFDVDQVLDLLRIDLMRSLGVSINDIARLLDGRARRRWPPCSTNTERCWCVSASGWIS